IPDDQKILLLKKGNGVYTGEFGNEGSGGQSFLRYNWQAETTYKFLLKGEPDGKGNTVYSAWFFAPEKNNWQLIASCFFREQKTMHCIRYFLFRRAHLLAKTCKYFRPANRSTENSVHLILHLQIPRYIPRSLS